MTSITVRPGRKEDMAQIYHIIKEFAISKNVAEEVTISPEILIENGFGPNPAFGIFVAYSTSDETKIVGYALYYHIFSAWVGKSVFLEDIFVHEKHRKLGVGKQLFLEVAKVAQAASEMKRLDFHVLAWNPASGFYKALGCTNMTQKQEWNLYRLESEDLERAIKSNKS